MIPDDATSDIHRRTEQWRGRRIAIWQAGRGPNVMLLHGFPSSSRDWLRVAASLSSHYRVTSFDFLGYGRSDKPVEHDYSVFGQTSLAQDLIARFCTAGHLTVVGHDLGGIVLQELLARRDGGGPDIAHAVFVNSSVYAELYRPTAAQRILRIPVLGAMAAARMTARSFEESLLKVSGRDSPELRREIAEMWREFSRDGGQMLAPKHLVYMGERVRAAPRLERAMEAQASRSLSFVYGAADPVSGALQLDRIATRIPGATITALPGLGHFPMLEDVQAFMQALFETLRT